MLKNLKVLPDSYLTSDVVIPNKTKGGYGLY